MVCFCIKFLLIYCVSLFYDGSTANSFIWDYIYQMYSYFDIIMFMAKNKWAATIWSNTSLESFSFKSSTGKSLATEFCLLVSFTSYPCISFLFLEFAYIGFLSLLFFWNRERIIKEVRKRKRFSIMLLPLYLFGIFIQHIHLSNLQNFFGMIRTLLLLQWYIRQTGFSFFPVRLGCNPSCFCLPISVLWILIFTTYNEGLSVLCLQWSSLLFIWNISPHYIEKLSHQDGIGHRMLPW